MEKDKIIEAIESGEISSNKISFTNIRSMPCCSHNDGKIWKQLEHGIKTIETQDQLNQYWYSYAPMIKNQWEEVFNDVNFLNSDNIEIIDYACGQGLASILFFDKYPKIKNYCSKITLIELSEIALNRAKSILGCYLPGAEIININKELDDVVEEEVKTDNEAVKIHLFSNILDIENFNTTDLFNKILKSKGLHHFLAVSHDRDHDGGSKRLKEVYNEFTNKKSSNFKIVNRIPPKKFKAKDKPAIYFYISFKV